MRVSEELRPRLAALLASPDSPDLLDTFGRPRGRRFTYAGDVFRRDEIKRDLGTAYVERRRQEIGGQDISCIVSLRRERRIHLVKSDRRTA